MSGHNPRRSYGESKSSVRFYPLADGRVCCIEAHPEYIIFAAADSEGEANLLRQQRGIRVVGKSARTIPAQTLVTKLGSCRRKRPAPSVQGRASDDSEDGKGTDRETESESSDEEVVLHELA